MITGRSDVPMAVEAMRAGASDFLEKPIRGVELLAGVVPHRISISRACGLVWNCNDIVPGGVFDDLQSNLEEVGQPVRRQTYSACAQAILSDIKQRMAAAA
jgi:DNA-binding response OmpR family regulator